MPDLSYEEAKEIFDCDFEKGILYWKEDSKIKCRHTTKYGNIASRKERKSRYDRVYLNDASYMAHRIIWTLHTGRVPIGVIDHINGDGHDNSISNLRDVTPMINCHNRVEHRNGERIGVYFHPRNKRWWASIMADNVRYSLGYYDTEEEAQEVYTRNNDRVMQGLPVENWREVRDRRRGVFLQPNGTYVVVIRRNYITYNLGTYHSKEEAVQAYNEAEYQIENNLPVTKHTKNKIKGVKQLKNGHWYARIMVDKVEYYLGTFGTLEQAHQAYLDAKNKLNMGEKIDAVSIKNKK